jgi:non-ribosomal peptide synthetase component F
LFHVAWARVVAATSGRDEVVFGTILSGRLHGAPAANRLGMFINTLPVCFDLRERSVRELIATVQAELAELLRHESASLALAQRSSGVSAGAPLFTSLLNYRHSKPGESDAGEGGALARIQVLGSYERTNYPLTVAVDDFGEAFVLTAQVDRRIQAAQVLGHLQTALHGLAEALERTPQRAAHRRAECD